MNNNRKFRMFLAIVTLIIILFVNIHAQASTQYEASITSFAGLNEFVETQSFNDLDDAIEWVETSYYNIAGNENIEYAVDWQYNIDSQYFGVSWDNNHYVIGNITYQVSNTQAKRK